MQMDYFLDSKMYSYNFEWLSDPRQEQNGAAKGFAPSDSSFATESAFPTVSESNPVWTFDTEYNPRPDQSVSSDEYAERRRQIAEEQRLWNKIWRPFLQLTPIHGLRKLQQDSAVPTRR